MNTIDLMDNMTADFISDFHEDYITETRTREVSLVKRLITND